MKEKIHIAEIYKQDGKIHIQCDDLETNIMEVYGFLKLFLKAIEEKKTEEMYDSMEGIK